LNNEKAHFQSGEWGRSVVMCGENGQPSPKPPKNLAVRARILTQKVCRVEGSRIGAETWSSLWKPEPQEQMACAHAAGEAPMECAETESLHECPPLAGIKVVDFGQYIAGPLAAR